MTTLNRRSLLRSALAAGAAAPLAFSGAPLRAQGIDWAGRKRRARVRGRQMACVETGSGRPIVFLHGNPTSSYLWRHVIPHVEHLGRCIAPDMIGMGDSDALPDSGPGAYKFATHRDYLFELFEAIGIADQVTFVVHDWGSGVGFSWAQQNPTRVRGIAYMEGI